MSELSLLQGRKRSRACLSAGLRAASFGRVYVSWRPLGAADFGQSKHPARSPVVRGCHFKATRSQTMHYCLIFVWQKHDL